MSAIVFIANTIATFITTITVMTISILILSFKSALQIFEDSYLKHEL